MFNLSNFIKKYGLILLIVVVGLIIGATVLHAHNKKKKLASQEARVQQAVATERAMPSLGSIARPFNNGGVMAMNSKDRVSSAPVDALPAEQGVAISTDPCQTLSGRKLTRCQRKESGERVGLGRALFGKKRRR